MKVKQKTQQIVVVLFVATDNEFVSIPIHIWLLRGFPKECPLVFVVSTNDQELASAVSYTDDKGKIKLPYLVDWKDVS